MRRQAFDKATDLTTLGDIQILLEGLTFEMVEKKLNDDHKTIFRAYRIDNSAKGLYPTYSVIQAIKFVADSESKSRKIIIITDNISDFKSICNGVIVVVSPSLFIEKVEKAIENYDSRLFSNIDDSLNAHFFI